jgi:hypothetical protein
MAKAGSLATRVRFQWRPPSEELSSDTDDGECASSLVESAKTA